MHAMHENTPKLGVSFFRRLPAHANAKGAVADYAYMAQDDNNGDT
jgi:hypothetical protein